ncbi:MAG TPA: hypothetical protein VJT75_02720, partial [Thermoleophilaceae bacterium]|nr:hypothetical protein [Thermoleophilaceae bacterium]
MTQRIDPERGPILAAGGVLLAAAVLMLDIRFDDDWANGVLLLIELAAFVVIFGIAWRSPLGERPLAYQATLALAGLVVLAPLLFRLADVLGVDDVNTGTLIWIAAIFTAVAWMAAQRFDSVGAALLAGVGAAIFVLSVIDKVFDPSSVQTFRWILVLLAIGFGVGARALMQGARPHFAVAAVDVAGLMIVALATTFALTQFASAFNPLSSGGANVSEPGFGWKLVLVVGSLAVIAYAAVTRERGPGFIGVIALAFSIFLIAEPRGEASIVGWPLVLLLAAGAALFLGLRPAAGGASGPSGGAA